MIRKPRLSFFRCLQSSKFVFEYGLTRLQMAGKHRGHREGKVFLKLEVTYFLIYKLEAPRNDSGLIN